MAINKVVYGNQTLMDLTSDTVTEQDVAQGVTFHDASGELRTGSASGGSGHIIEDASGKKIYIKTYERNSKARVACLNHYGAKCQICGFDAKEVYGSEFEGKIEVHHIKPINERDGTYKIDPEKDLIPVCPNCHMILHTKINGIEPNINYIKDKINKHKHCGE